MKKIAITGAMILLLVIVPNIQLAEAASCTFRTTLSEGTTSEDVRCLQKFLNTQGFTISETGAGSLGKETDEFRAKTKEAVAKWQKASGLVDDGIFGPGSIAQYNKVMGTQEVVPVTTPTSTTSELALLRAELRELQAKVTATTPKEVSVIPSSMDFGTVIKNAVKQLLSAQDDIEEAEDEGVDTDAAQEDYDQAVKYFILAISAQVNGETANASKYASLSYESILDAKKYIDEVKEEAGDLEDQIDDLDDELNDIEDLIEDADDDGEDVDEAEDLLDEAHDLLDEVNDEFEGEDYEDARDLMKDLNEVIEDIYRELGEDRDGDKSDAEDAIEDAEDAISDAEDAIDEANGNTDDAEELLEEAEDALKDAEDAFDDKEYKKAIRYAKEAEDLAKDAEDEL